ncbi:MAG TPA: hypothetical protein VGM44_12675 [Polyangiaceae bacterium]
MFPVQFAEITENRAAAPDATDGSHPTGFALELDPVSLLSLYRVGATFELTLSEKLALNFTPSYELALDGGVFGEFGLRRYSSHLSGIFVGLSVLAGSFSHSCEEFRSTRQGTLYGLAGDVGYQWLSPRGVVIGLGVGAQIQRSITECKVEGTELEQPLVVPSVSTTGVLPRLQFAIGYSWSS